MYFDPTYNYGNSDLNDEQNLACFKFCELIKNLLTLSSDADRQCEIIGIGAVCDEMAVDFETYFSHSYKLYLEHHLLTPEQMEALQDLDAFFEARSGSDFWDDFLLDTHPDWQAVRQKAKAILKLLGMQDLAIEFDREEKHEMTALGEKLIMQSTKTRIVRQNVS